MKDLRSIVQYLRDPRTDKRSKIITLLVILYAIWPLEIIPDVIPFLGWLDDLGLLGLAYWYVGRAVERWSVEQSIKKDARDVRISRGERGG